MKALASGARIATYLRSRSPDGPNAPTAQRDAFAAWRTAHPDLVLVHASEDLDGDASLALARRPGLRGLLAAVERGEVDGVLVTSVDRLSRDQREVYALVRSLQRRGVEVWAIHAERGGSVGDGLDLLDELLKQVPPSLAR